MADKDLQMQRKKSDGTFDKYYPKTKTHLVVDDATGQTIKEQYKNIVDGIIIVNKAENAINSENANKLDNKSASEFAKTSHDHIKSEIIDFPTSLPANGGTSASCSGNAATATRLQTVRKINSVNFDGTADVTIADSTKAPINHASTSNTYGLGTAANFGHVKTINGLTQASHIDGTALSAYQGKVLDDKINALLPNSLTFTSSGTWVCPIGASRIYAVLIGGGGNGNAGSGGNATDAGNGGTGGGYSYPNFIVGKKVTPGTSYPYIIGGVSGQTSFLDSTANGGATGGSSGGGNGARDAISGYNGQSARVSTPGGNGYPSSTNNIQVSETTYYVCGGAGGGGGGTTTYGSSAGGTATNGGGTGGAGGAASANGAAGGAATGYGCGGGGGGGGGTGATTGGAGGAGKQGIIYMWYE